MRSDEVNKPEKPPVEQNHEDTEEFDNNTDSVGVLDGDEPQGGQSSESGIEVEPSVPMQSQVEIEDATFYCKLCGNSFEDFELFAKHSIEKHGEAPGVKCGQCERGFIDQDTLERHVKDEHEIITKEEENISEKDYQCSLCNKIIRTKTGIERHEELYCEECKKCSSERTSFRNHNGVYHKPTSTSDTENNIYICERCEKSYDGIQNLNNHFCDPRPPQTIRCEQCY